MRILSAVVAATAFFTLSGCSQVVQLEPSQISTESELKNLTVRTRTGEVYFFEEARVAGETVVGHAQETKAVYTTGAQVEYITEYRDVTLRIEQVEQATLRERNWGKTLLFAGVLAGAITAIVLVASSSSADETNGGDGGPKPPLPVP